MATVEFHSRYLDATEQFLNKHYTTMRIGRGPRAAPVSSRITRESFGTVTLDRVDLAFDMVYDADPLGKICLCVVESGRIETTTPGETAYTFGPGELGIPTPPDLPYSGVVHDARYTITMLEPTEIERLASTAAGSAPVRLTGHRPVSDAACHALIDTLTHLREMATRYPDGVPPLIAASATHYLAASVLTAFPNTAVTADTTGDRHDAHPGTVRRALSYMETHVRDDIAVADIAAAAFVTVRALQLAFRRHLDTTPMAYLRRLRLHGAHEQLVATTSGDRATVTAIAAEWGFAHPGRFAAMYRRHYGRSPAGVLAGDTGVVGHLMPQPPPVRKVDENHSFSGWDGTFRAPGRG
ncbi:helix-turn-helix domain-containing protein [Nocardia wallacei]|uniref:helix-turn-helix domain-containing protein n=1 Tax=Nocardia wallacei TaxID=480035 RepID=UPI00165750A2|nr:helix-turn-helix domain-containing protein [Nocardia wallacei]